MAAKDIMSMKPASANNALCFSAANPKSSYRIVLSPDLYGKSCSLFGSQETGVSGLISGSTPQRVDFSGGAGHERFRLHFRSGTRATGRR